MCTMYFQSLDFIHFNQMVTEQKDKKMSMLLLEQNLDAAVDYYPNTFFYYFFIVLLIIKMGLKENVKKAKGVYGTPTSQKLY